MRVRSHGIRGFVISCTLKQRRKMMKTRKPFKLASRHGEAMSSESRASLRDDLQSAQFSSHPDAFNTIYGLMPVLEALRGGQKQLEHITIAEGARHERLRELLDRKSTRLNSSH